MPIPRSELVEPDERGLYQRVSRCVRRTFLCGGLNGEFEHRRLWLEQRLEELAGIFAIDVVSYVVMSNHMHLLLWTDPHRVARWSDLEVARRWLRLFPGPDQRVRPQELATQIVADRDRGADPRQPLVAELVPPLPEGRGSPLKKRQPGASAGR